MKKLALIILFISPLMLRGHAGGHYASGDLMKIWHLTNGQTIQGNFSFGDNQQLILEKSQGEKVRISLDMLQQNDRKIAQFKIDRYQQIHLDEIPYSPEVPSKNPYTFPQWMALFCLGLLMVYIMRKGVNQVILVPAGMAYFFLLI